MTLVVSPHISCPLTDASAITLSGLVIVHDEEHQLAECLACLCFADEIVVLLDQCHDHSKEIAHSFTDRLIEGAWSLEGDRRNAGIAACRGQWIVEVDADERVDPLLAQEIRAVISCTQYDVHTILVDNYIGSQLVRYGWGAYFGKAGYPGLFRKGAKVWGPQRVHPEITFHGIIGWNLHNRLQHYVDHNISDMIHRLDRYSCARAQDLRNTDHEETFATNLRRFFSRFFKCYILRKGYREGRYGFLLALFAGLYPLLSYLKATLEDGRSRHSYFAHWR
ncbi:glycosyl transferase [invertebrate metagenome]|uniref:Glycosyl transferase n=1 Tax=invertebrate metagenome TaxID=1711999 RepID=A0A484H5F6_9ZZZZ